MDLFKEEGINRRTMLTEIWIIQNGDLDVQADLTKDGDRADYVSHICVCYCYSKSSEMVDKKVPSDRALTSIPCAHPVNKFLNCVHAILSIIINDSLISCAKVGKHTSLN